MSDDRFRRELVAALRKKLDPAGCTQRQAGDMRTCGAFWPLRLDRWCLACLLTAAVEELESK